MRAHNAAAALAERILGDWFLATLARLVFAAVLFNYFWASALTKLGDGISGLWNLAPGAYVQILPQEFEAAGYDTAGLTGFQKFTVYFGTYAELILPILLVAGLFTRIAALGMIGFVIVMTYTDVVGHGVDAETMGAFFDRASNAAYDQRALWMFLFVFLAVKGPGPFSIDALLGRVTR